MSSHMIRGMRVIIPKELTVSKEDVLYYITRHVYNLNLWNRHIIVEERGKNIHIDRDNFTYCLNPNLIRDCAEAVRK